MCFVADTEVITLLVALQCIVIAIVIVIFNDQLNFQRHCYEKNKQFFMIIAHKTVTVPRMQFYAKLATEYYAMTCAHKMHSVP